MRALLSLAVLATVTTGCATEAPHALDAHLALDADASHEISASAPARAQAAAVDAVREAPVTDGLIHPNVAIDAPDPVTALVDCGVGTLDVAIDQDAASSVDETPAEALILVLEGAWVPAADSSLLEVMADPTRQLDVDGAYVAVHEGEGAAPWLTEMTRSDAAVDADADLVATLGELREEVCQRAEHCDDMDPTLDMDAEHDLTVSVYEDAIVAENAACRLVMARD